MAPALPFPIDAMGALQNAAEALHSHTQAPLAMCAQSVLAAATLAVQPHRDVELPGAGIRPLTGIFATVAESGERKSSCDKLALRAVYRFEEALRREHDPAIAAYAADRGAWEAATQAAKKAGRGDRSRIREQLEAIGPEPKAPPHPMLLVGDPTPEALILHLQHGRPWGGLFTDEGGALVGGHAMNDDNRMKTGALLNQLWDGSPIRRLRVGSGSTFLPGRRCSAHIMMQHAVASKFFGDATLQGIGTVARVLLVAPDTTAGTRMFREPGLGAKTYLGDYHARLGYLLERKPAHKPDDAGVLDPPALKLASNASRAWIALHDEAERDMRPDGRFAPIRAFASKMAEHAGRIAAVLAVYAEPDATHIETSTIECGGRLARHYAAEMLRLGEAAQVAPDMRLAQRLLDWWLARPDPRCHLVEIYQLGPSPLRDAATAKRAVATLEENGWIDRLPAGTILDGAMRRDAWELTA